jgi:hypothetical protein
MNNALKTFIFIALLQPMLADEKSSAPTGRGKGVHHTYRMEEWDGHAQAITRLDKADASYEFIRITKNCFQIQKAGPAPEVLFSFDSSFKDGGVIENDGMLVDVIEDENEVSALMYGTRGYYMATAAKAPPVLAQGFFYYVPKPLRVKNWHLLSSVRSRDYYESIKDVRYPLSEKIAEARLLKPGTIEFTFRDRDGVVHKPDVFSLNGRMLLKNGVEVRGSMVRTYVFSEQEFLDSLEDKRLSDAVIKELFLQTFGDKKEFMSAISNFKNKDVHSKLEKRFDSVFSGK